MFQGQLLERHPAMADRLLSDLKARFANCYYLDSKRPYFSRVVGATRIALGARDVSCNESSRALSSFSTSVERLNKGANPELFWQPIVLRSAGR